jgi:CHAD domain-containing protein
MEGGMEVEAKFAVSDSDTLARLCRAVRLGPFEPGPVSVRKVLDEYWDTPARVLYENGYACRVRRGGEGRIVTIKGLGTAGSAVHQRFESECVLPDGAGPDPRTWPEWEGRDLIVPLVGDQDLELLFTVDQVRRVRDLYLDKRIVAELFLDDVQIRAGGRHKVFSVLEAELSASGTMDELLTLAEHLSETWGLAPEPHSKFEMGLALLDDEAVSGPESNLLTPAERFQLVRIAGQGEQERFQRWAALVLGWGQGASVRELSEQMGMSSSWAYELIRRFRQERMDLFPADVVPGLEQDFARGVDSEGSPSVSARAARQSLGQLGEGAPERMTVSEMCERFRVDMEHATRVAEHVESLFDATASIHKMDPGRRELARLAGVLHNVGFDQDPDRHHVVGRDIILDVALEGVTDIERRMLAAAVYLHRKRATPRRLKAEVVTSLPPGMRDDALALASLLRIADGLDYSQTQSSTVQEIQASSAAVRVVVAGPFAETDIARARAKADLWERLFDVPFFLMGPEGPSQPAVERGQAQGSGQVEISPVAGSAPVGAPGIVPDEPMSEAGRKVLYLHLVRMIENEPGTRDGQDIEALHDMRVATRRMRSAFRVFGPFFKPRAIRSYASGLRQTARVLGAVRDLDVLMAKARVYLVELPAENAHDLDPLLDVWEGQREKARGKMIAHLDSAKYHDFVQAFKLFLETPGAGARTDDSIPPRPMRVNTVVPGLIYARWAGVQAFEPILKGAPIAVLHALRIECKRLRYTLEFFDQVLGPTAEEVITEVVRLQDHLGNLNDANVANALLSDFLFSSSRAGSSERMIAPGVVTYLAARQRELQTLIDTFPSAWERFNRPEVRQALAQAIAVL